MACPTESNPADLCRVCIQNVTYVSSENIFQPTGSECPTIHSKLSAICPQVFADESAEQKPLAEGAPGLPLNVCMDCKSRIDEAYKLHQMCIESNQKLCEMLTAFVEVTIKEEFQNVIKIEPTQLQPPNEVFAEYLDIPAEKSPPIEKSKVRKLNANESKANRKKLIETAKKPSNEVFAEYLDNPSEKSPPIEKSKVRKLNANESKVKRKKIEETKNIGCERCSFKTNRVPNLNSHMRRKHANEIIKCNKCYAVYFDEVKLEEHKIIHTIAKPYPCPNCNKFFKTQRNVVVHSNLCTGKTPYLCTECGKAFSYNGSYHQHILRHKEKSFACDQCPVKFHTKGSLQRHSMLTHSKEKKFSCETCGTRFLSKNGVERHMLIHTDERPYPCDLCSLRFRAPHHLMRHKLTHTGEKPYKCTHCDRAFAQSGDLAKHSKTHFGSNPYKCDWCDADFRLITELRNHYKVHYESGEIQDPPEALEFTIASTLKRRAEQEKSRDHRNIDQDSDEQDEDSEGV